MRHRLIVVLIGTGPGTLQSGLHLVGAYPGRLQHIVSVQYLQRLQLSANGHKAKFANEFVSGLPAGFTGVLDITSPTPFAALTMRSLNNERNDFLLTTFPIADQNRSAPSPIVFPQIADGGGYVTQFILIGAGGASSVTLNFYGEDGKPLPVGK